MKEKAENFVDGAGYGAFSALLSIYSAIGGIFLQPIKKTREKGIKGTPIVKIMIKVNNLGIAIRYNRGIFEAYQWRIGLHFPDF